MTHHLIEAYAALDSRGITILNDNQHLSKNSIDLLQQIINGAIVIVGADKSLLQLLDSKSSALVAAVQRGFDEPFLKFFESVRDDASTVRAAMRSRKQVIVADLLNSEFFAETALIQAGIRAVISTPLIGRKDTLLGMMSMYFRQPHHPDSRELHLIELLSQQVACHLELMHAERIESILYREVQHRSNNLLSIVQVIARHTLSGVRTLDQGRRSFEGRLQALARFNRELLESDSVGLSLRTIVNAELGRFRDRTITDGIDIAIRSQLAQNLSLALHELVMNAIQYGALSTKSGMVGIFWKVESNGCNQVLNLKWRESGGPRERLRAEAGFGMSLLKAVCPGVHFDYALEGLRCEIRMVLDDGERKLEPVEVID
jgi:two-component sensor histidine kinase